MEKSLTILFRVLTFDGHVNACIGLAERLRNRGHTIVFVTKESYRERLIQYGFTAELIRDDKTDENNNNNNNKDNKNTAEVWAQQLLSMGILSDISIDEKLELMRILNATVLTQAKSEESFVKSCIDRYNPDIIIVDNLTPCPSIRSAGKPWLSICSLNPLHVLNHHKLPPPLSGYSAQSESKEWYGFKERLNKIIATQTDKLNEWYSDSGYPTISRQTIADVSPYLTIYDYPIELDYTDIVAYPSNLYRVDHFMRTESGVFDIPEQLRHGSGKVIYFSMGSMGSIDIDMMSRLLAILSQSKHGFIVSKGPLHYRHHLSDNMWGAEYLPQTLVLPLVDLVITHGGNNTVTETLCFGKPMIVMPLFADQFDNARRIEEKGFGVRLNPHSCTKHELLAVIDQLLTDETLRDKLKAISRRIQNDSSLEKAAEVIEKFRI